MNKYLPDIRYLFVVRTIITMTLYPIVLYWIVKFLFNPAPHNLALTFLAGLILVFLDILILVFLDIWLIVSIFSSLEQKDQNNK